MLGSPESRPPRDPADPPGGALPEPDAEAAEAAAEHRPGHPNTRARASALVSAGILLSRISGLVRERAFAHFFGAGPSADAWRAALRLPNVVQNLLGEGTLSASYIPVYAELLEEGREREAARFAGAVLGLLTMTAGALAFLGVVAAPWLVAIVFAGFDPGRQALTVSLVRILFPMTALLAVSAWALGTLNSHRRFLLPYAAPVIWNGAMIGAMLLGGLAWGMAGEELAIVLGWGALAGGALQVLVQLPLTLHLLGEFRPSLSTRVHGVREAVRNFLPVVAARGAVNLGGLADYWLAGFLTVGAVATLGYAQILFMLPISLFGMAVAASELPEISRGRVEERKRGVGAKDGDLPDHANQLRPGAGHDRGPEPAGSDRAAAVTRFAAEVTAAGTRVAYYLVPSTVAYLLLGDVIVAAIFETGAFGRDEILVTWAILGAYALGMGASATSRFLSSAFYAARDTVTPARIAYIRILLALAVGAALMFPLDRIRVGAFGLGPAGLALGSAVAAWVEVRLLRRRLDELAGRGIRLGGRRLARVVLAGLMAGGAALLLRMVLPPLNPWLLAAGTLLPFGGVYVVATRLLGVSGPLEGLLHRAHRPPS